MEVYAWLIDLIHRQKNCPRGWFSGGSKKRSKHRGTIQYCTCQRGDGLNGQMFTICEFSLKKMKFFQILQQLRRNGTVGPDQPTSPAAFTAKIRRLPEKATSDRLPTRNTSSWWPWSPRKSTRRSRRSSRPSSANTSTGNSSRRKAPHPETPRNPFSPLRRRPVPFHGPSHRRVASSRGQKAPHPSNPSHRLWPLRRRRRESSTTTIRITTMKNSTIRNSPWTWTTTPDFRRTRAKMAMVSRIFIAGFPRRTCRTFSGMKINWARRRFE